MKKFILNGRDSAMPEKNSPNSKPLNIKLPDA